MRVMPHTFGFLDGKRRAGNAGGSPAGMYNCQNGRILYESECEIVFFKQKLHYWSSSTLLNYFLLTFLPKITIFRSATKGQPFFQSYSSKPAGMGLILITVTPRTQDPAL
jgi:hypothetical protein